jgi:hypothetical protein
VNGSVVPQICLSRRNFVSAFSMSSGVFAVHPFQHQLVGDLIVDLPLLRSQLHVPLDDLNVGQIEHVPLEPTEHHALHTLRQFALVLDADDLLVLVAAEDAVAVDEGPVVRVGVRVDPVQQTPQLVGLVEDRRTREQERPARPQLLARLGALRLRVLEVVSFIEDRHVEADRVELVEVSPDLLVVHDQDARTVRPWANSASCSARFFGLPSRIM